MPLADDSTIPALSWRAGRGPGGRASSAFAEGAGRSKFEINERGYGGWELTWARWDKARGQTTFITLHSSEDLEDLTDLAEAVNRMGAEDDVHFFGARRAVTFYGRFIWDDTGVRLVRFDDGRVVEIPAGGGASASKDAVRLALKGQYGSGKVTNISDSEARDAILQYHRARRASARAGEAGARHGPGVGAVEGLGITPEMITELESKRAREMEEYTEGDDASAGRAATNDDDWWFGQE